MDVPVIPATFGLTAALASIDFRLARLRERRDHNPRRKPEAGHRAMLSQQLGILDQQRQIVCTLLSRHPAVDWDADVLGLLVAWIAGHEESRKELGQLAVETGHPHAGELTALRMLDYGRACELLCRS